MYMKRHACTFLSIYLSIYLYIFTDIYLLPRGTINFIGYHKTTFLLVLQSRKTPVGVTEKKTPVGITEQKDSCWCYRAESS